MLLAIFGFLDLSFTDILDILLVALIIFSVFRWLKDSAAMNIFLTIIFIYVLMVVVDALHMKMMSKLVSTFIDVGVLALIVIFQPEIRHFMMKFGAGAKIGSKTRTVVNKLLGLSKGTMDNSTVNEITEACRTMSEQKTGALIVIPHEININYIIVHLIGIFAGIVLCYFIGKVKTKKTIEEVKTEIKENKNIEEISLIPPVNGEVKDVSQSSDQTFASKAMGDGILVNPIDEVFVAPADAKVELVFPTKHAIGLTLKDGSQILIHCGINTVTMNGEGFETYVEEGQEVKQGDKLVKMDLKKVQEAGHSTQTLIIVNEVGQGSKVIVDANSKTPIIIKKA